jgi:SAM-dependent methyltransferase
VIKHPKDIEYFDMYPAPVLEAVHNDHFTNINSTITFLGPMLYFLARALCVEKVLEIGHAEGYTSRYLAHAVKDNARRFGLSHCRYYGIDIAQTEKTKDNLIKEGLPVEVYNLDSLGLPGPLSGLEFDMIFQDGAHDTEHVIHEFETMWPQLRGEGKGYWIFHDCYGPAEDGFREILQDHRRHPSCRRWPFAYEFVRIDCVYGMAIMRNMAGYDEKKHWKE